MRLISRRISIINDQKTFVLLFTMVRTITMFTMVTPIKMVVMFQHKLAANSGDR